MNGFHPPQCEMVVKYAGYMRYFFLLCIIYRHNIIKIFSLEGMSKGNAGKISTLNHWISDCMRRASPGLSLNRCSPKYAAWCKMVSRSTLINLLSLSVGTCKYCRRSKISFLRYLAAMWSMFSSRSFLCSIAWGNRLRITSTISVIPFLAAEISGVSEDKVGRECSPSSFATSSSSIVPNHDLSVWARIVASLSTLFCCIFMSQSLLTAGNPINITWESKMTLAFHKNH